MITNLDNRLSLCARFVRSGAKLADIGTDHAYLPVYLCRCGKCPAAVAADINPEPLKRGAETISAAGLDGRIKTRLSDGLKNINSDEADDIVIAGMGGELIAKIIDECSFAKDKSKRFILQPMTKSEYLIEWLCRNGYKITDRDCCEAANKCYTVILAEYTGKAAEQDEIYYYLARLNPKNETHLRFLKSHIERLNKQANGDVRFAVLAKQLEEIINGNDK